MRPFCLILKQNFTFAKRDMINGYFQILYFLFGIHFEFKVENMAEKIFSLFFHFSSSKALAECGKTQKARERNKKL